jgi:hypothetical protein
MRFTVGGESFDLTKEQIIGAMEGVAAEPVREHVVEVDAHMFPPKQVFAAVTGRARQSFTTMEAQRVLRRLGFVCRRADRPDGSAARLDIQEDAGAEPSAEARLGHLEATLGTVQAAIAGLHLRVSDLEAAR